MTPPDYAAVRRHARCGVRTLALRLADDKLADLEAKASENADHFQDGGGNNFEMYVLTTVQDVRATLARILKGETK